MNANELDFCLLIPCYNNFEGLIESLKSVSYPEDKYLILIIDDGSDIPLEEEKIKTHLGKKKPIKLLSNEKNNGITKTLNHGLSWIEKNTFSKYIARLDCGDICVSDRFSIQVEHMDLHPEIGLLGSWCRFIDEKTGLKYSYKTATQHSAIAREMYFRNVFMHATVMFRTSLLKKTGYYPLDFDYAEDYAFFWKLIRLGQSVVLDKFLVICNVNRGGLSFKNRRKQLAARWKVVNTFSNRPLLKIIAFTKLKLLYFIPKGLVLRLKRQALSNVLSICLVISYLPY
jgi:glycosyltransferase involved in cell wall biosynthesis